MPESKRCLDSFPLGAGLAVMCWLVVSVMPNCEGVLGVWMVLRLALSRCVSEVCRPCTQGSEMVVLSVSGWASDTSSNDMAGPRGGRMVRESGAFNAIRTFLTRLACKHTP